MAYGPLKVAPDRDGGGGVELTADCAHGEHRPFWTHLTQKMAREFVQEITMALETPQPSDGEPRYTAATNPHATSIAGYRKMTDEELALFNEGKAVALMVREYSEKVKALPDHDGRWAAIGITDLQRGFMALFRAIARPDGF